MTITNDFVENESLADSGRKPITALNVGHYIEEHNIDRALGYLEALEDFKNQLEKTYIKNRHNNNGVIYVQPYSEAKILKNIMQLDNNQFDLLKAMKVLIQNKKSTGLEQPPVI